MKAVWIRQIMWPRRDEDKDMRDLGQQNSWREFVRKRETKSYVPQKNTVSKKDTTAGIR